MQYRFDSDIAEKALALDGKTVRYSFRDVRLSIVDTADGVMANGRDTYDAVIELLTEPEPEQKPSSKRTAGGITDRQASYLTSLLRRSDLQSVYGPLYKVDGEVDTVAVRQLTKTVASRIISEVTGR